MKKVLTAVLAALMVFVLAACGASQSSSGSKSSSGSSSKASKSNGKVLVVYFSGTGNTERVANDIAERTGGSIFKITPSDPYTDQDLNYTDDDSRVNKEHEDTSLQNVQLTTTDVPDWDSYDTVYFGYPIWWGNAAWPVNNFVKNNDFSGKTVIPFCTSYSSGIGDSGSSLENMTNTGNWQKGHRFSENASKSTVNKWVDSLN